MEHPNHSQSFSLELSKTLVCSCVQPPLRCNCSADALPPLLPGARVGDNKVSLLFQSVWVSLEGDAVGFSSERPSSTCRGATGSFSCITSQRTPEPWKCPIRVEKCAKLRATILSYFSATEKHVWRSLPKKFVFRQTKIHRCQVLLLCTCTIFDSDGCSWGRSLERTPAVPALVTYVTNPAETGKCSGGT